MNVGLAIGTLGLILMPIRALGCDAFPVAPGALVREYQQSNGLTFREFDTDDDGAADYGTATLESQEWPLFYATGFDDPGFFQDAHRPFVATIMWIDKGGIGKCSDIRVYFIRRNKDLWNPDKEHGT